MKFFTSIFIALILLSGCSNKNEQLISVQKRVGDGYQSVAYKEPIESNKALKAMEILKNANWEKVKSDMVKIPDYVFYFNKRKPGTKIVVYSVWISPDKDKLELMKEDGSKYVQLNREKSQLIFEAMTDYEN